MFLISVFILIATFFVWIQLKTRRKNELLAKIPSRKKVFFLENSLDFFGKSPQEIFDMFEDMKNELGPVFNWSFNIFDSGFVMITDPKLTEIVLSSQTLIDKGAEYNVMKDWLGNGLLLSTGKKWQQRRKILTPTFHFQILEKFVEVMDENCKTLLKKLQITDGRQINIMPYINLFALDVICESSMGCKINAQLDDSEYVRATKELVTIFFLRNFDVLTRNDLTYRFSSMYKREKELLKIMHKFTNKVIENRRSEFEKNNNKDEKSDDTGVKKRLAFMDLLLEAKVDGEPLTNEEIQNEVDTFMFAGHDTTTGGISFCLLNIAKYPEVQAKILEEIDSIIGDRDDHLTIKDLNDLRYLEKVIKESLRMYPSVAFISRKLKEETTIGEYTMPKHCNLNFSPYLMGRDEKLFPDPLKFKPERFDADATGDKINPFAYIPFSAGPRNCIGQKFAMLEMKLTIARIIQKFEVKVLPENANPRINNEIVLKAENGINLNFHARTTIRIQ